MGRGEAATRIVVEQFQSILWSARSAGATLIISRGNDPATVRLMMEQGLVRERLGHLVLTPMGLVRRRACTPHARITH